MSHGLDQMPSAVTGQLGVGVKRDDIFDVRRYRTVAFNEKSGWLQRTQETIEGFELSSFALAAHPALFPLVPLSGPVEKQKGPAPVAGVGVIKPFYAASRQV